MTTTTAPTPESCPIDPQAREEWLRRARITGERPPHPLPDLDSTSSTSTSTSTSVFPFSFSFRFPAPHDAQIRQAQRLAASQSINKTQSLSQDREVSTIPRARPSTQTTPNPSSRPANHENESGADPATGNWIYPSEKMFFDAMRRKNFDPQSTDMRAIVPIHNAVNERAWSEIKRWEKRFAWSREESERCGGPKLVSFSGDVTRLSPRARWKALWGYMEPFDRHDWIVERCPGGSSVEYVIDFYEGKAQASGQSARTLNFHLDVRPKLNSWEGWKMRIANAVGFW